MFAFSDYGMSAQSNRIPETDEEEAPRRRKRAKYDRRPNGIHAEQRVDTHQHTQQSPADKRADTHQQTLRTPMDRLMIQSFLNFSEAAPDALGTGQEMNLRFGE